MHILYAVHCECEHTFLQIETDDKSWKGEGDYLWTEYKPPSFFPQTPHILELDVNQSRRKAGR